MPQTKFAALKAMLVSLSALSLEQLVEGFVRQAEFCDPKTATTYEARQERVLACCAHASELARREALLELVPLLRSPDSWVVYCAADRLSLYEGFETLTLSALDRIVESKAAGAVTKLADLRRNGIREYERGRGEGGK